MNYITRINLKTDSNDRNQLIQFCLHNEEQWVVMGWSYIYENNADQIQTFKDYYYAVKNSLNEENKRDGGRRKLNHAFSVFWYTQKNDLFWTRDLDGQYWICRAKGSAQTMCSMEMDIGAAIPVEAYKVGLEVPGQIKASFNQPRGGICQKLYSEAIVEYSKKVFNENAGRTEYNYKKLDSCLLDNLPDFELEELAISYLQIRENYYLLSNSIANKSTTIKIECELISRDKENPRKAVVQVKGGKDKTLDALDFTAYTEKGILVYLYAPHVINLDQDNLCIEITREQLLAFYEEYKGILPDSITVWSTLF